jgi:hypothetical protein
MYILCVSAQSLPILEGVRAALALKLAGVALNMTGPRSFTPTIILILTWRITRRVEDSDTVAMGSGFYLLREGHVGDVEASVQVKVGVIVLNPAPAFAGVVD